MCQREKFVSKKRERSYKERNVSQTNFREMKLKRRVLKFQGGKMRKKNVRDTSFILIQNVGWWIELITFQLEIYVNYR